MSVLTTIDGIPLFSDSNSASVWGRQFGLSGFHTHTFQGRTGYMSGPDHATTVTAFKPSPVTPTVTRTTTTSGSGGGGGGY